jgi:hypothetical protein
MKNNITVSWDPSKKVWGWEEPKWFQDMGYFSLGTFVAKKLERVNPSILNSYLRVSSGIMDEILAST